MNLGAMLTCPMQRQGSHGHGNPGKASRHREILKVLENAWNLMLSYRVIGEIICIFYGFTRITKFNLFKSIWK